VKSEATAWQKLVLGRGEKEDRAEVRKRKVPKQILRIMGFNDGGTFKRGEVGHCRN